MIQKSFVIGISVLLLWLAIFLLFVAKSALCGEKTPANGPNPIVNAFDNAVWKSLDGACQILHLK